MKNWRPQNELEQAMRGAMKSPAGHPAFLRLLRESEVCFLMPWHPELEADEGEEFSGAPPALAVWQNERGPHVPVFCTTERAQEALERMHPGDDAPRWIIGAMNGADLLGILSKRKHALVINPSCETGEVYLNSQIVRNLAPGLSLPKKGESRSSAVKAALRARCKAKAARCSGVACRASQRRRPSFSTAVANDSLNRVSPCTKTT